MINKLVPLPSCSSEKVKIKVPILIAYIGRNNEIIARDIENNEFKEEYELTDLISNEIISNFDNTFVHLIIKIQDKDLSVLLKSSLISVRNKGIPFINRIYNNEEYGLPEISYVHVDILKFETKENEPCHFLIQTGVCDINFIKSHIESEDFSKILSERIEEFVDDYVSISIEDIIPYPRRFR